MKVHLEKAGYEVYCCDIGEGEVENYFQYNQTINGYDDLFRSTQFDVCINCSGSASVPFSYVNPVLDFQMNVASMFYLLNSIHNYQKNCRFIQLSSAAVYGNPKTLPVKVSDQMKPLSIYGHHKKMAEEICIEFNQIYQLPVTIARIFSAYGPGLRKQLFWDLHLKSKSENTIQLFGTGDETRDFIYITDLIEAIHLLMQKGKTDGSIYNLASGKEVKIREAADLFIKNFAPERKIEFTGNIREGDPIGWKADITDLISLGFKPTVWFEEGIRNYAIWLQQGK